MSEGKRRWADEESLEARHPNKAGLPIRLIVIWGLVIAMIPTALLFWPSGPGREAIFFNRSDEGLADPRHISVWWGDVPEDVRQISTQRRRYTPSNIHRSRLCWAGRL
jgi:hypothetical protein